MARKKSVKKKEIDKKLENFRKKQISLAKKFTDAVLKKYKKIVKAVVLFGSLVRGDFTTKSDVDILVIIDDTAARFSPEMKMRFDDELYMLAKDISKSITVQPAWSLTEFWDMARIGHPLLYTIVRDGWALYDTGFFIPVRKLLEMGKIPTTIEAVEKFMETAPQKINRVENAKLFMVAEDLYYAMLNSSQAVLMYLGQSPPSPKHTPLDVKEHLVKNGLLEETYLNDLEEVKKKKKMVEHKEIKEISGVDLDKMIEKAKKYVSRMEQLLDYLQKRKKEDLIKKNYEVLIKASVACLKKLNKLPPDPKDLPNAIKKYLVGNGVVEPYLINVFKDAVSMRKMLEEGKATDIPQKDIELVREYVRRFVQTVGPIIEGRVKLENIAKSTKPKKKRRKKRSQKKK